MRHGPFIAITIFASAWIGLWYAQMQPYEIEVPASQKEARLIARSGTVLHTWPGLIGGYTDQEFLFHSPPQYPDTSIAVLPFIRRNGEGGPIGLCAFDVGRKEYDDPLWCRSVEKVDLPDVEDFKKRAGFKPSNFVPGYVWTMDIFAEEPGTEIVAVFSHTYSRRVLRVYSLDGRILYQAWYDGDIFSVFWLHDPGLLVVAGSNCQDGGGWDKRGYNEVEQQNPLVLFAIRLRKGFLSREFLRVTEGSSDLDPVWYRCVLPARSSDVFIDARLRAPITYDPDGSHVSYQLRYRQSSSVTVDWIVDAKGEIILGAGVETDTYKRQKQLPRLDQFHLGDLPPVQVSGESAGQ